MAIFLRIMMTGFENALVAGSKSLFCWPWPAWCSGICRYRTAKHQTPDGLFIHRPYGLCIGRLRAASQAGVASVVLYMALYVVMTLGTFACILSMRRDSGPVERIDDLAGLSQTRPFMAFCLAVMMFSLAGIPPMAGFFGKLFVFRAAIDAGLYSLSIIGVLASVVGAYYYLRIVKIMYLDAPADEVNEPMPRELSVLAGVMTAFTLLFFIYPAPLVELADMASSVLVQSDLSLAAD